MNVNNVRLERTAVNPNQYPVDGKPEIAFVGRSNVGKSSLINYLINRKSLARVSSAPGKTRVINFYNIEEKLYFVDLPGYGYAKVAKSEKELWGNMIEKYFSSRRELKLVALLVDARHTPTDLDKVMISWIMQNGLDFVVLATKSDKINRSELEKNIEDIRNTLGIIEKNIIIPVSSLKKTGKEQVWEIIEQKMQII